MNGIRLSWSSDRHSRQSVKPSITGIRMSERIRSGGLFRADSRASAPLFAERGSIPFPFRSASRK